MSWSDDIRCLFCDGKLPLYRKITHGQFCSTAHRKAYWQEQERLAVERLHQTHNSLRAYRSPVPAEAILGPTAAVASELSGFISDPLLPHSAGTPRMIAADLVAFENDWHPAPPVFTIAPTPPREIVAAGPVPVSLILEVRDYVVYPEPLELTRCEASTGPYWPALSHVSNTVMPAGHWVCLSRTGSSSLLTIAPRLATVAPLPARLLSPALDLALAMAPLSLPIEQPVEVAAPLSHRLFALLRFGVCPGSPASPVGAREPVILIPRVLLFSLIVKNDKVRTPASAGLLRLSLAEAAPTQRILIVEHVVEHVVEHREATRGVAPAVPQIPVFTPLLSPQLKMAEGSRYGVQFRPTLPRMAEPEATEFVVLPEDISLPRRAATNREDYVPDPAGKVEVPTEIGKAIRPALLRAKPPAALASTLSGIPQPLRVEPVRPLSRLEPLDEKPFSDAMQPPVPPTAKDAPVAESAPAPRAHLWTHAAGFWKNAPRDLKLLMFAIPALLALAFHPSLPKVSVAATGTTGELQRNMTTAVSGQLATVRQAVYERAAVGLDEDFRSGLDDWASRGDATTEWSFDATGFVRPGPLALYRPSMNLTDYQLQFLGLIEHKALSWVVRAADFNNYYVVKLVVLKPGPQTTVGITRYAVIDGKAQERADTVVPIEARPDMLYRVRMDVQGDSFSLAIQGQMVDTWSETHLRHGGVGFFSARGEGSRVRWVQVTHQYDMLGRLCAYLAPYDIPTTNGSW